MGVCVGVGVHVPECTFKFLSSYLIILMFPLKDFS